MIYNIIKQTFLHFIQVGVIGRILRRVVKCVGIVGKSIRKLISRWSCRGDRVYFRHHYFTIVSTCLDLPFSDIDQQLESYVFVRIF